MGIDPGLANTGFGVVQAVGSSFNALDGGVIETSSSDQLPSRLSAIRQTVKRLIERYQPDFISTESLYFGRNVSSALAVGQALGVVLVTADELGVNWSSYTPQQIKIAVCGSGAADKSQVSKMVQMLLGLDSMPRPEHAADALAAAICHLNHQPLLAAVAK